MRSPDELLADLRSIEGSLVADGGEFSAAGDLRDVIRQVEVFGFHFATLDIRQHVKVAPRGARGGVRDARHRLGLCAGCPSPSAPRCWSRTSANGAR